MIRRPPSVIPMRQSDVEEVQQFLARKLAAAKEQRTEDSLMDDSAAETSAQQGAASNLGTSKGKGRAQQDELIQQEEQSRQTRSQASRADRIGL